MNSYKQELQSFTKKWPTICFLDLIFTDINATPRGKRIPVSSAKKLASGIYLPLSTLTLNIQGQVIEEAGFGQDIGEPDHLCLPIPGTLKPTVNPEVGQVMLTMMDDTESLPLPLTPRQLLSNLVDRLHRKNQFPVMAIELEFYLLDKNRGPNGEILTPINPTKQSRETSCEVYHLDSLDDYSAFLSEVSEAAEQQGLHTSGALAESAPGQFEINFYHQQNILEVCDHVIYAKRLVRQVAQKHGYDVTFMAKPFGNEAGNGLHVHLSLLDEQGNNLFSNVDGEKSDLFYQCLAAMTMLAPESMALLAPNVNAYRRFGTGMFTPDKADWGVNHRGVALRIPVSDSKNRRIEHRIAGADVNPYLLCVAVLASVIHANHLSSNNCPPALDDNAPKLPLHMQDALHAFKCGELLPDILGREFTDLYVTCKESELRTFEKFITPKEIEWMFYSA